MALTPDEYIEALYEAGAPRGAGLLELDREAARMLQVDERTARRYRKGVRPVPGPVAVALFALAAAKGI